ncbi:type i fatty acid, partial [Cystoisospora suis]
MSGDEVASAIFSGVAAAARRVLGSGEDPPADAPLHELGIDSLSAVEFRNILQERFGVRLPATLLFDCPTAQAVSELVCSMVSPALPSRDADASAIDEGIVTSAGDPNSPEIAVIGMACRLPGSANDLEQFWQILLSSKDCIQAIPLSRFSIDSVYDPDPDTTGKIYVREGGFIDDADLFDNRFFNISGSEAQEMDWRQRVCLEVSYEAFSDADYSLRKLKGSATGVFVGAMNHDKLDSTLENANSLTATGGHISILSNRLSYNYGLTGSSLTIDTACSSSLVAMDVAMKEITFQGCDAALIVGVNIMNTPQHYFDTSRARMLSPECRCKTFDTSANGYVRSEGCGAVVLQRNLIRQERRAHAYLRST